MHNKIIFAKAYSLHVEQVYRYVLSRVENTQAAEDITAETFLAALEHYDNFRGKGTLAAWIFGIARHKIADYFRSNQIAPSLEVASDVASTEPSPLQEVQFQIELEQVLQGLQRLSPDRVDALTLHIFGELSIIETSQVLGKSEAAARMLIYRAVQDLKALLTEQEGIEK